jgi:beta-alanine degradation protein BauB
MADVATTKLMENDKVTVWEMVLEPGESTGMHTHEHSYVIQVLEGSVIRATDENGQNPVDLHLKADRTHWVEVSKGEVLLGDKPTSATHDAQNVGPNRYRELLIEIK